MSEAYLKEREMRTDLVGRKREPIVAREIMLYLKGQSGSVKSGSGTDNEN